MEIANVKGQLIDEQTRCVHYKGELDIIAIKFKCCNTYYPCFECHKQAVDHLPKVWKKEERHEHAFLCGVCKTELTISDYLNSGNICPSCHAHFNPRCELHYHLYFEV